MNIDLIRGDTLNIQFEIESDTILDLESENFLITFSLKQAATNNGYIFQKDKTAVTSIADNTFIMRIAPTDTEDLIPGWYYYDLQLTIGEDVYTIALGKLQLVRDITLPPSPLPAFVYPDIDGDGTVTTDDAGMILTAYGNILAGNPSGLTDAQEDMADCNRDGRIDGTDATLCLSFISDCDKGKYTNTANGWSEFMANHYEIQE